MEDSAKRLYKLIAEHFNKETITQSELANIFNTSPQAVNNWEKRGVPPAIAIEAETNYGISAVLLTKGVQTIVPPKHGDLSVPIYNKAASLGFGNISDEERIVDYVVVTKAWVRSNLPQITNVNNLSIIPTTGDSMSPTIESGSLLWIDTGVNTVEYDGIYAISMGNRFFVKRIVFNPLKKMLIISSDNPCAGESWEVDETNYQDLIVHGKVLLAWNPKRV